MDNEDTYIRKLKFDENQEKVNVSFVKLSDDVEINQFEHVQGK